MNTFLQIVGGNYTSNNGTPIKEAKDKPRLQSQASTINTASLADYIILKSWVIKFSQISGVNPTSTTGTPA